MSVDPTPYDLEQDEAIQEIRDVVTATPPTNDGAEESFPVVGYGMNDEQWSHLAKAFGSGVLSYGASPYRRGTVSDVSNTIVIRKADDDGRDSGAVIEGFAHRMLGDVTVEVPAVTTTTDYVIGIQYDPVRAKGVGIPLKLDCFSRPLDTSQGKKYAPIWEGTRKPSTVLSSVEWVTARSRIAPTTTVRTEERLPDPRHSGLMWGTICYTYDDRKWFQLTDASSPDGWTQIGAEWTDWTNPGDTAAYVWAGHGYRRGYRYRGTELELRGRIARSNGGNFVNGGGGTGKGYQMYSIADQKAWPKREQRFITSSGGTTNQRLCVVTVDTDGVVYAQPILGDVSWLSLDGIRVVLEG